MRTQVTINFKQNNEAYVDWYNDSFPEESNISNTDNMSETDSSGYKGFQFSQSKEKVTTPLDGTYKFYPDSGYPGMLSLQQSKSNEITRIASYPFEAAVAIDFYISNNTEYLYITFDTKCKEYATSFELYNNDNGNSVLVDYNEQCNVRVPLQDLNITGGTTLTLYIYYWSRPYASAKVTRITSILTSVYTGKDIEEFTCSENVYDAQLSIQPGIVEQYADVSVYDKDNLLHDLAQQGELVKDSNVRIHAIDDFDNQKAHLLGAYNVSEWNIHSNDAIVSIYCNDVSSTFDQITIASIPIKDRSVDEMLSLLFSYTSETRWRYIDTDTKEYCRNIITPNNWFYPGTLKELLNKICIVGMIRIFWYINTFVVARCW